MKLSDIMKSIEENEYLVYDKTIELAVTFDRAMRIDHAETKIKRIFKINDDDTITELPVEKIVDDLAEALVHTIDAKQLMKKVIGEMVPLDLVKAHEIITKNPEIAKKATALHHCLIVQVENPNPGEKAIEIPLRY